MCDPACGLKTHWNTSLLPTLRLVWRSSIYEPTYQPKELSSLRLEDFEGAVSCKWPLANRQWPLLSQALLLSLVKADGVCTCSCAPKERRSVAQHNSAMDGVATFIRFYPRNAELLRNPHPMVEKHRGYMHLTKD